MLSASSLHIVSNLQSRVCHWEKEDVEERGRIEPEKVRISAFKSSETNGLNGNVRDVSLYPLKPHKSKPAAWQTISSSTPKLGNI